MLWPDQYEESPMESDRSERIPVQKPLAGRFVFLDYGRSRIGVAISDPTGRIALPSHTIDLKRQRGVSPVEAASKSLQHLNVGRLIVGLPLELSGREGPMAAEARQFGMALGAALGVTAEFYDERLTSRRADQSLRQMGFRRRERDAHSDEVAACQMLQEVLELYVSPPPSPD
jgi:putative holliday junction resolvase